MTSKRVFLLMLLLLGIATTGLIGSVVFGDQMLQRKAKKLTDLKIENAVIDAQQTALVKAKKDIATYTELNKIAKQIVPQDKDQARAVREIITIAQQSGVGVKSITFPASNLGQSAPAASGSTDGTSKTGESADSKNATPPVSQVRPVDGITGVYQLELSVNTDASKPITYVQLIDFLGRLEQNRRTAQITNLSIQPSATNRNQLTFNVQLTIYIKP